MAAHLSVRLYWHDSGWNGRVCRDPDANTWCEAHEHVRDYKDRDAERACHGCRIGTKDVRPPCEGSAMAFSSEGAEIAVHPPNFMTWTKPTRWALEPATTLIWPYEGMWTDDGEHLSNEERREKVESFLDDIEKGRTLAFFYVDERNPLVLDQDGQSRTRVLVGISRVLEIGEMGHWDDPNPWSKEHDMVWGVPMKHAWPKDGVRLPVQELLAKVPDPEVRRKYLVLLDGDLRTDFRYGTGKVHIDRCVAVLERAAAAVQAIQRDEVLETDMEPIQRWINGRLLELWEERGPYPGLGALHEALGGSRGAELQTSWIPVVAADGVDALDVWEHAIEEGEGDGLDDFEDDLEEVGEAWGYLDEDERRLARVLARMALTTKQVERLINADRRTAHGLPDAAMLAENPYLLVERYLAPEGEERIGFDTVDHGLLPHDSMKRTEARATRRDPRRVRALLVEVLRAAADDGHTFLDAAVALERAAALTPEDRRCDLPAAWLERDKLAAHLKGVVEIVTEDERVWLALDELRRDELLIEQVVVSDLLDRDRLTVEGVDWQQVEARLAEEGGRGARTLSDEQVAALDIMFRSPFSILTGGAGTGKSTLLEPLISAVREQHGAKHLRALAPTGKAAQRLVHLNIDAQTIHRALARAGWFDWELMRLREVGERKILVDTLIIDECSMIDVRLLATLFRAIDWSGVQRLVMVGDHYQLPPIGPGRPFYDLVGACGRAAGDEKASHLWNDRLCELTRNYRVEEERSSAMGLAQSFARRQDEDPDVWSRLARGGQDGDLSVVYWKDAAQLEALLLEHVERVGHDAIAAATEGQRSREERWWIPQLLAPGGEGAWYIIFVQPAEKDGERTHRMRLVYQTKRHKLTDPEAGETIQLGEKLAVVRAALKDGKIPDKVLARITKKVLEHDDGEALEEAVEWANPTECAFDVTTGLVGPLGADWWQIISPVRGDQHGVAHVNAVVQGRFRAANKKRTTEWGGVSFGDEQLTLDDKVIQIRNHRGRDAYANRAKCKVDLVNGQLGVVTGCHPWPFAKHGFPKRAKYLRVRFEDLDEDVQVSYTRTGKKSVNVNLELAYAITVHKSQGSEFQHVFCILPKLVASRAMRELVYTALTRGRKSLTLFVEGDVGTLLPLRKLSAAATVRRNSRLLGFHAGAENCYRGDGLVHVTRRGERVRSKSEVIIADRLYSFEAEGLTYEYEAELRGEGGEHDLRLPDFTIKYRGQTWYWEHCGMLHDEAYRRRWNDKRLPWYRRNGHEGRLIITQDSPEAGFAVDVDGIVRTKIMGA